MKSERSYPIYKVNKKAEASLVGGHPWVYENDILEFPETEPENGTLADVVSPKGAYLGTGFVSLKSKIRVRLISRNANDTFDASFWRRRVEYAWASRQKSGSSTSWKRWASPSSSCSTAPTPTPPRQERWRQKWKRAMAGPFCL